ncbi:LysE family translocator [Sodalis sp. dw_96]|uniref:LysE family translocator n=1 Tax=Sodalis sp. dw_96 TaxID=2719794 RepID=UPI001BD64D1F|nr:LysE family translocator [Sodalis sp. dw_96]
MFDFSTLGTFVAVVMGLFLIPGPAVLLVLSRTVQGGRKTGIMTGLGIASGDFVHTLCAAAGLSALLMTSALAFNTVKYVGAAYLIYLGIRAIAEKQHDASLMKLPTVTPMKAYLQAVPAEVLNPKTALFFLAFMPQFIHPERGPVLMQFAVLGLIFVALSSLYTTLIALSIRPLSHIVKRLTWLRRRQGKIVGAIFITQGLSVATQHQ